jgi:hypothetical protein
MREASSVVSRIRSGGSSDYRAGARRIPEGICGAAVAVTNDLSTGTSCNSRDTMPSGVRRARAGGRAARATTSMCAGGREAQLCTRPTAGGVGVKGSSAQLRVGGTDACRGPQSCDAVSCAGERAASRSWHSKRKREGRGAFVRGRPNGLSLSCTARAHVPKPTRRGGCRRGVACNDWQIATAVTPPILVC